MSDTTSTVDVNSGRQFLGYVVERDKGKRWEAFDCAGGAIGVFTSPSAAVKAVHEVADARRYIEHCALWKAVAPFDVKGSWTSLIPKEQIAAIGGEPGTFLGDNLVDNAKEERFLDLAGWKDAAGAAEPDVTSGSKNVFSNREAVATLYNKDDAAGGNKTLRESRFWYHAELIKNERLRRLLSATRDPDLVKALDTFSHAALLNYYFFFPAHDEALGEGCSNIEALEFGAYAGEWACMSVLLERNDPQAAFRPVLLGFSGRWLAPADPLSAAQAPADNDEAQRIVMKVVPFTRARLTDEHPSLFVARGTHSIYLDPGSFNVVYGPGLEPRSCSMEQTPPAKPSESARTPCWPR